jgi:outer membrane protein TolC
MYKIKLALVFIAALGTAVVAQTPPTKEEKPATPKAEPSLSLEWQVQKALANSADVLLAEAKVREAQSQLHTAEAVLRQTRSQVTQKVIETRRNVDAQRRVAQLAEATLDVYRNLKGQASKIEIMKAEQEAMTAKAQFVESETRLDILTGQLPAGVLDQITPALSTQKRPVESVVAKKAPPLEMAERMRKALTQTIKLPNDSTTVGALVDEIRRQVPTVPISLSERDMSHPVLISLKGDVTLGGCFQLFSDTIGVQTRVRDYGFMLYVAWQDFQPPQDAMTLQEFSELTK